MPKEIMEPFNNPRAVKFLATVDEDGKPNNAMIGSMMAVDEETLAFADMMMKKTRVNLESTGKVAATVWKPAMASFQVKGKFAGWVTAGPIIDMYNQPDPIRLSVTSNVDKVGLIKVEEIYLSQMPFPGRRLA
jgi:hypothetical protein